MNLCNFCAAGSLTIYALQAHWQRGFGECDMCGKEKSYMRIDSDDKDLWLRSDVRVSARQRMKLGK